MTYLRPTIPNAIVRLTVMMACIQLGLAMILRVPVASAPTLVVSWLLGTFVVVAIWSALVWQRINRPEMAKLFDLSRYLELSDDSLAARMEDGAEYRHPWSHYSRAVRRGELTYVHRLDKSLIVVPDSVFSSREDLAAFQTLLKEKGLLKNAQRSQDDEVPNRI